MKNKKKQKNKTENREIFVVVKLFLFFHATMTVKY